MTEALAEYTLPPPQEDEWVPAAGPWDWVRRNLFRSWIDGIVTVVAAFVIAYVVYRAGKFVFVSGRWEVVRRNLALFMVGPNYPREQLWRVGVGLCLIAGYGGIVAGYVYRRRIVTGREDQRRPSVVRRVGDLDVRLWPLLLGLVVLLGLTTTPGPTVVVVLVVASAIVGRIVGGCLVRRIWLGAIVAVGVVGPFLLLWFLTRPAPVSEWGGMMLNVFLAAAGIGLSFPLGVLLALGRRAGRRTESRAGGIVVALLLSVPVVVLLVRRGVDPEDVMTWVLLAVAVLLGVGGYRIGRTSTLPLVRVVSITYIEFFRGVPLYVLLLLGGVAIGFFLPRGMETPGVITRAVVVFTVFTAAYIAEIVRGGLQSLPRGQTEAAQALGLSPVKTTALIVLPQALRNVIPAIVGQFISLFKDTTLAGAAMSGITEVFRVRSIATGQADFRGQQLVPEILTFMMFLFWVGCITMSRESQRLERRLGVGTR
jgi:general L-amino acid transport system permease protein